MARPAACLMCGGVSKSGSPTTRLTIERPSRRRWLARSAADVLGGGLMRLTRSATRMESTMYPIELLKRGLRYSRLWTVAKTTSLCLYSDLLWIGLLWIGGPRHEPEAPPVLREDRRYRQPDAGRRYPPR